MILNASLPPGLVEALMGHCTLCGFEIADCRPYLFQSDAFRAIYTVGRVYECSSCRLIQTDVSKISDAALTEYYRTAYRAEAKIVSNGSQANQSKYLGRANAILKAVQRHIKSPPRRVFEVGSGYGYNLKAIKDAFPDAVLATDELDQDLQGAMGTQKGELEEGPYDVVILSHVLEHFRDPIQLLKRSLAALADGGIMVVEVPNDEDGISVITDCDEPHLTFFGSATLQRAVTAAGGAIIEISTCGPNKNEAQGRKRMRKLIGLVPGAIPLLDRLRRGPGTPGLPDYSTPIPGGIFLRAVVSRGKS